MREFSVVAKWRLAILLAFSVCVFCEGSRLASVLVIMQLTLEMQIFVLIASPFSYVLHISPCQIFS